MIVQFVLLLVFFNNYLISEHYVSELIYLTLAVGDNPQPYCIRFVSIVEYGIILNQYSIITNAAAFKRALLAKNVKTIYTKACIFLGIQIFE